MSGTSLDGVDLAYIEFNYQAKWTYKLGVCDTIPYDKKWLKELKGLHLKDKNYIDKIDKEYSDYLSIILEDFISKNKLEIDAICSHGHTVLHEPNKGVTLQIGNGKRIRESTGIAVVSNFRTLDVQLGGQGAPLVPVGDELLFSDYDYCLNLGGFSNFSYSSNGKRLAYDICPLNIALNYYVSQLGLEYDEDGKIAKIGQLNEKLLSALNGLKYYSQKPPKSLGKEWLEKTFIPLVDEFDDTIENKVRTLVEHMAIQLAYSIPYGNCLVSGGGAFNSYLMQRIKALSNANFILADKKLIEYKEALIFGLLGVLKIEGKINCLASVTGAKRDSTVGEYFI